MGDAQLAAADYYDFNVGCKIHDEYWKCMDYYRGTSLIEICVSRVYDEVKENGTLTLHYTNCSIIDVINVNKEDGIITQIGSGGLCKNLTLYNPKIIYEHIMKTFVTNKNKKF